jgi:hypothetical protein
MVSKHIPLVAAFLAGIVLTGCAHKDSRSARGMMDKSAMDCKHMMDRSDKAGHEEARKPAEPGDMKGRKSGCPMMGKAKDTPGAEQSGKDQHKH